MGSLPGRRRIEAAKGSYRRLQIAKGLVVAPCEAMIPLSEDDWAMPWDAVVRP